MKIFDFLKGFSPDETIKSEEICFEDFKKLLNLKLEDSASLLDLTDSELMKVYEKAKKAGSTKEDLEKFIEKIVYSDYCGYCEKMTPFTISSEKGGVVKSCLLCNDTAFEDLDSDVSYFNEIDSDIDFGTEDDPYNKRSQEIIEPHNWEKEIGASAVKV